MDCITRAPTLICYQVLLTWLLSCTGHRLSKEKLSSLHLQASRATSIGFVCPEECMECCKYDKERFKCVLKQRYGVAAKPALRECEDVEQRGGPDLESQAKVKCKYYEGEKESLQDASHELNTKCSSISRCCCDTRAIGVCIGNRYHESRLLRSFSPSINVPTDSFFRFLPDMKLTLNKIWNMCPAGFSDWSDGQNTPCECARACGTGGFAREERAKEDSDIWQQYLSMASGIYVGEPLVSGWTLEVLWDTFGDRTFLGMQGIDYVGIYRRIQGETKKCALAFAGTDDKNNVFSDVLGWMRYAGKWCGFEGVHASFGNYMRRFMVKGSKFETFVKFLSDPDKCTIGHRYALGHSLGGSLASLFVACANRPHENETISDKATLFPDNFKFDGLYTFGAASVATEMLTNRQASNGCFPGGRFWLTKKDRRPTSKLKRKIDLVPNIGSWRIPAGLRHPRMDSIAVEETVSEEGTSTYAYKVFKCDDRIGETEKDMNRSTFLQLQAPWGRKGLWQGRFSDYHRTMDYWSSMQHMDSAKDLVVNTNESIEMLMQSAPF